MGLKEQIQENSQIDLNWLAQETKDLKEHIVYFEGLLEREAYRPNSNRALTMEIIDNLKINLKTVQEEYVRRTQDKKTK